MDNGIIQLFPQQYRAFWRRTAEEQEHIQEIRLRAGRPVILHRKGREAYLDEKGELTEIGRASCRERVWTWV